MRLFPEKTAMLLVDVQERLFMHIEDHERIEKHLIALIQGLQHLEIPILCNQQYTQGLGETISSLRAVLHEKSVYEKRTFSCCQNGDVMAILKALNVTCVVVAGVESHVCVLQSVRDLIEAGFEVMLCVDAIGSRKYKDHEVALRRMEKEGAWLCTTESLLFELVQSANHTHFKAISGLVKTL